MTTPLPDPARRLLIRLLQGSETLPDALIDVAREHSRAERADTSADSSIRVRLVRRPELHPALALSRTGRIPAPAPVAIAYLLRPDLTSELARTAIAREKRVTVLREVAGRTGGSPALYEQLAATGDVDIVVALLGHMGTPASAVPAILETLQTRVHGAKRVTVEDGLVSLGREVREAMAQQCTAVWVARAMLDSQWIFLGPQGRRNVVDVLVDDLTSGGRVRQTATLTDLIRRLQRGDDAELSEHVFNRLAAADPALDRAMLATRLGLAERLGLRLDPNPDAHLHLPWATVVAPGARHVVPWASLAAVLEGAGEDRHRWELLLRFAPGFTGTVEDMLTLVADLS